MSSPASSKQFDEKDVYQVNSDSPVEVGHSSKVGLKQRLRFSWEVRQEESSFAKSKNASNADFDPIPPSKRTWNWMAYVAYWMADAWAVSNWEVGKSFLHYGRMLAIRAVTDMIDHSLIHDCCRT